MLSEAEARQVIGVEGAKVLLDIVEGAWRAYQAEQRPRLRPTVPVIIWDYMNQRAITQLSGMEGVRLIGDDQRPRFVLQEHIIMNFKKHSEELLTRTYPTRAQKILAADGAFEGMEWPYVSCGYTLDAAEADIDQVVVVRRVANRVEWYISVRELASGVLEPTTPIFDGLPGSVPLAKLPSIARKKRLPEGREL